MEFWFWCSLGTDHSSVLVEVILDFCFFCYLEPSKVCLNVLADTQWYHFHDCLFSSIKSFGVSFLALRVYHWWLLLFLSIPSSSYFCEFQSNFYNICPLLNFNSFTSQFLYILNSLCLKILRLEFLVLTNSSL